MVEFRPLGEPSIFYLRESHNIADYISHYHLFTKFWSILELLEIFIHIDTNRILGLYVKTREYGSMRINNFNYPYIDHNL